MNMNEGGLARGDIRNAVGTTIMPFLAQPHEDMVYSLVVWA